jgi:hypothetical protein
MPNVANKTIMLGVIMLSALAPNSSPYLGLVLTSSECLRFIKMLVVFPPDRVVSTRHLRGGHEEPGVAFTTLYSHFYLAMGLVCKSACPWQGFTV